MVDLEVIRMKAQEIKTVSYVHVGDKLVNTQDLDSEQKKRWAHGLTRRF